MLTDHTELPIGPTDAAAPPVSRLRPNLVGRAVITVLFTGVQAWAITVAVLYIPVAGVERLALAAALAASVLTVLDAWRDVWGATRRAGHRQLVWAAATAGGSAVGHITR